MVTYSSNLAWEIPWTKEPGRLQSMGLKESDITSQLKLQQQNEDNSSSSVGLFSGLNELVQHREHGGSFPDGSDGKEPACNAGDLDSIPRSGDPLDEGMATHSSILAWRIPWTEEADVLQSTGSQSVKHD